MVVESFVIVLAVGYVACFDPKMAELTFHLPQDTLLVHHGVGPTIRHKLNRCLPCQHRSREPLPVLSKPIIQIVVPSLFEGVEPFDLMLGPELSEGLYSARLFR